MKVTKVELIPIRPQKGLLAFASIALSDEQIATITFYLKEIHESESKFHNESLDALRKEQDKIQRRIGQIYDDKLDGVIDEKIYLEKVREYKARQIELIDEMKRHEKAEICCSNTSNPTVKLVLFCFQINLGLSN